VTFLGTQTLDPLERIVRMCRVMSVDTWSYVLLWIVVAVEGVLLLGVHYHVGLLERAVDPTADAVPARSALNGQPAPAFSLPDLRTGRMLSPAAFGARRGILLFLTSSCETCAELAESLALVPPGTEALIVVARGRDLEAKVPAYLPCVRDRKGALLQRYHVNKVPAAVLINETGTIARTVFPTSGGDVVDLLRLAVETEPAAGVDVRGAAPMAAV
jgi:hypothetical protein